MLWFEALARYEYALRIDEDVCIQRFESNPFRTIRERGLVYGYGLQVPRSHRPTHCIQNSFGVMITSHHRQMSGTRRHCKPFPNG